ncbi:MAG: type II toxin-antitoxin system VapC family toxin [Treponema sp.]|nr:type II toxin-antitoxin system VapC family toxin [Treponema sp.]
MDYVLDTNVAFEIAFCGSRADEYRKILENASSVIVPDLYKSEITNVLWQYVRAGYLDEQNAKIIMIDLMNLVDNYVSAEENSVESLHEAIRLNHSAYDMFYFTLARRYGAVLLTMDKKLKETAEREGVQVI